jgi:hypothetical protein
MDESVMWLFFYELILLDTRLFQNGQARAMHNECYFKNPKKIIM